MCSSNSSLTSSYRHPSSQEQEQETSEQEQEQEQQGALKLNERQLHHRSAGESCGYRAQRHVAPSPAEAPAGAAAEAATDREQAR